MRAFPILFLIIFLAFYLFITYASVVSISKIITSRQKKGMLSFIILFLTILFIFTFVFLYIWPFNARNASDYSWYLLYNAILSIDFVFKIPLSLSYLSGIIIYRRKKPVIYSIGLIMSICLSLSVLYGSVSGKNELTVNKLELEFNNLPEEFDGYKIVQFSDTHLGSFIHSKKLMQKVEREISKLKPSLILFTGDLVNNFASELTGWEEIFQKINVNKKSFAILGNHDYGNYTNWVNENLKALNFEYIVNAHSNFGFRLLRNEHTILKEKNDSIFIVGVENWGHPPFPQYADLNKAMSNIPENSFIILLTHDPAHWHSVVKDRKDIALSLSGHTHGLQWGIKKAGITFSLSYFVRQNWGGFYRFGNSQLYVNTGMGMVGIPWRINMPGEITLITLKRVKID